MLEGAPGLSRTLLSQRLKQLERLGVVESASKPDRRGAHYGSTRRATTSSRSANRSASRGARWLEIAPEHLDPFVALWSMSERAPPRPAPQIDASSSASTSPAARTVSATGYSSSSEHEICKTDPGFDEDLYITAEAEAFVKWHAGQLTWAQATRDDRIQLDGSPSLVREFPTWNARSMFAHIQAGLPHRHDPAV